MNTIATLYPWEKEYYRIDKVFDTRKMEYVKTICLLGYFYDVGEPGYNNITGKEDEFYTSRFVEYIVKFDLQDFIDRFVNGNEDFVETDEYDSRTEYITDLDNNTATTLMLDGNYIQLDFSELTIHTPCGCYVERWDKDSELL